MSADKIQDHWIFNVLVTLLMFVVLCTIAPPYFIFKFIQMIVKLFYKEEDMAGKVALITGASSGIGEYMAYEYARRKANLVIVARRESRLREVAERARSLGSPDVVVVCADVSNIDDCNMFVEKAIQHFGRLDHLVNNAGISAAYSMKDAIYLDKFEPVMDINFWGSVYPTYFAIPYLRKTKGMIIVNSSAAGFMHPPKQALYSATKAALISFYEALRAEIAPSIGITILTLGYIESEIIRGRQLRKDGMVETDKKWMERTILFPVMSTRPCAEAIVRGACRRERYVVEPQYMKALYVLRTLFPELVEFYYRTFHLPKFEGSKSNNSEVSSPFLVQTKAN